MEDGNDVLEEVGLEGLLEKHRILDRRDGLSVLKLCFTRVPRTVHPIPCGTVGWDAHMGVPRTVHPVPCRTVGWDKHMGVPRT